MKQHKRLALALMAGATMMLVPVTQATAATTPVTSTFAGTITSTMRVNNGTNTGSIPAGTPYTGTLTYDAGQAPAPVAYGGGTRTVYTFTNLAFTVGTSTANSGPGRIDVYDNLTSAQGYPNGDSIYVNFAGVAPTGLLAGAAFNWMGLALLDPTGAAVSGGTLPSNLNTANFPTHFSEFNFGTLGTPWGAGNTSMIQSLTTLSSSGGTVTPPPISFAATLPNGTVGVAYSAAFAPATGGTGSFTYSATGLPAGLSLSGTTVSGVPTTAGTSTVTLKATDSAGSSVSVSATVTIAAPALIIATSSLPAGTVGVDYQAPVQAAGGVAPYAVTVSGLPAGLAFDGTNITGRPSVAGSYVVTVSVTDSMSTSTTASLGLTIAPDQSGSYTVKDEARGKITAIDPNGTFLMVGNKKLIWDANTRITVNTEAGELHVIDSHVQVGMKVQWKGLRDRATNTVLTSQLEVN